MISVKQLLKGKKPSQIFSLTPEQTVMEALELMAEKNIGAVMVMEGENLAGIFSERDYARKGIIMERQANTTPLRDVMTPKVFTVTSEMNIDDCMQLFIDKRIRHLPVLSENKLIGMLSIGD